MNQAGRDINQTTNVYHTSNESAEDPVKKKQDEHDLKIIDQILDCCLMRILLNGLSRAT